MMAPSEEERFEVVKAEIREILGRVWPFEDRWDALMKLLQDEKKLLQIYRPLQFLSQKKRMHSYFSAQLEKMKSVEGLEGWHIEGFARQMTSQLGKFAHGDAQEKIKELANRLHGKTDNEISLYLGDVMDWKILESRGYQLPAFIGRVSIYIHGGDLNATACDGMIKIGKKKLARRIVRLPEFRRMRHFGELNKFLANQIETIQKGMYNWEGFEEFYGNLHKGKNYIKQLEEWGDTDIASMLKSIEKDVHEQPDKWKTQLSWLETKLMNPTFQHFTVFEPLRNKLIEVFREELGNSNAQKVALHELEGILKDVAKTIKIYEKECIEKLRQIKKTVAEREKEMVPHQQKKKELEMLARRIFYRGAKKYSAASSIVAKALPMVALARGPPMRTRGHHSRQEMEGRLRIDNLEWEMKNIASQPLVDEADLRKIQELKAVFWQVVIPALVARDALAQKVLSNFVMGPTEGSVAPQMAANDERWQRLATG